MKSKVISEANARILAHVITMVGAKKQIDALSQKLKDADDRFLPLRDLLIDEVKNIPAVYSHVRTIPEKQKGFKSKKGDDRYNIRKVLELLGYRIGRWDDDGQAKAAQQVFDMPERDYDYEHKNHVSFNVAIEGELPKYEYKEGKLKKCRENFYVQLFSNQAPPKGGSYYNREQVDVTYDNRFTPFLEAKNKLADEMEEMKKNLDALNQDVYVNIRKMNTTKKVIENWSEVEPLVRKMWGEEEVKSAPEVPLGNIINRHLLQLTDQSEVAA